MLHEGAVAAHARSRDRSFPREDAPVMSRPHVPNRRRVPRPRAGRPPRRDACGAAAGHGASRRPRVAPPTGWLRPRPSHADRVRPRRRDRGRAVGRDPGRADRHARLESRLGELDDGDEPRRAGARGQPQGFAATLSSSARTRGPRGRPQVRPPRHAGRLGACQRPGDRSPGRVRCGCQDDAGGVRDPHREPCSRHWVRLRCAPRRAPGGHQRRRRR